MLCTYSNFQFVDVGYSNIYLTAFLSLLSTSKSTFVEVGVPTEGLFIITVIHMPHKNVYLITLV